MKTLLIFTIVLILAIFSFNKYQEYQRFNGPSTMYSAKEGIDINYHDKSFLQNYFNSIEQLNGFVATQWSAHRIDVVNPQYDNKKTNYAVNEYAKKLAEIKFVEKILLESRKLKNNGFNDKDVKFFEEKELPFELFNKKEKESLYNEIILKSYNEFRAKKGSVNMLVFELQKLLNKNGAVIKVDGVFNEETKSALLNFEKQENLYPDGELDLLTLNALLN